MKTLSKSAELSRVYTNHCMKATVVTNLDEAGHEARDSTIVSSHKSERSIRSYAIQCPPKKKRKMFGDLSKEFTPAVLKPKPKPTSTALQMENVTEEPEPAEIPYEHKTLNEQEKIQLLVVYQIKLLLLLMLL